MRYKYTHVRLHYLTAALTIDHKNSVAGGDTAALLSTPPANALASLALDSFEQVIRNTPGFLQRQGQQAMAQCIATTLSAADLGEHPQPTRAIALVQAGTGIGKSAAYVSTTIAMALERKTRVLISTATVALQEQLVHKDLPALARSMGRPFTYALAKGRNRYVCKVKLAHLVQSSGAENALFESEHASPGRANNAEQKTNQEHRLHWYNTLAASLATGQWDGDRDNLTQAPDATDWSVVAAERHTCTARHCPNFRDCSYYLARAKLAQVNVIVANHDLVLASLDMKTLPDLENCLVVFDEGHHLPAVALKQFSCAMDVSNLRWIDRLPRVLQEVAHGLQLAITPDIELVCSQFKTGLAEVSRLAMDMVQLETKGHPTTLRFANGLLPQALHEPVSLVLELANILFQTLQTLGQDIKGLVKEDPSRALVCAKEYAKLGTLAPRISSVLDTSTLLLEHGAQPLAKWLEVHHENGFMALSVHACPIVPGDLLRQFLWSKVRAAVVTSATLSSCGNFDYFLREAGLNDLAYVHTLEVGSPFDYARQGCLTVVHTRAEPKHAQAYTAEMVRELLFDLERIEKGALVLFTSRAQMQSAVEALTSTLKERVLVQGSYTRVQLLARHAQRVQAQLPSVIFGLQSFGEGLDLPGTLCETVCIAKLPFASPSDPVDEARAEWLRSLGRDPFMELVVPATAMRLLQWTGRALRSEDDHAHIICYDKRLQLQSYGRKILASLPPYPLQRRESQF